MQLPETKRYTVYVSQDGYDAGVAAVVREFGVTHFQHSRESGLDNPQYIARHYRYARLLLVPMSCSLGWSIIEFVLFMLRGSLGLLLTRYLSIKALARYRLEDGSLCCLSF